MSSIVPSQPDVQATYVATVVDEWVACGLREAVLCPGSRSTPLALAVMARAEISTSVRIDERSAAFFALGLARLHQRPVLIVVTSGTAAAELHAAVAEADAAHVALLVVTADRPPELHGVGAPQTMPQTHLFGRQVRRFEEPGVPRWSARHSWRPLAQRVWDSAVGNETTAGPSHLNMALTEPLIGDAQELPPRRAVASVRLDVAPAQMPSWPSTATRVLCVVGAGTTRTMVQQAIALNWVVVGDATTPDTLPYADPLVRHDAWWETLRPDVIVRLGGLPASKALMSRLSAFDGPIIGVRAAGPVADPDGVISNLVPGGVPLDHERAGGDPTYVNEWRLATSRAGEWLATYDDQWNEITVTRRVISTANAHRVAVVVGSSMPIRDVEWFAPTRETVVIANRGVNGIDGVTSTFCGVASARPAIGLVGDVTMLHDVSALVEGVEDGNGTLVVLDNCGGGIFNFLPTAQLVDEATFTRLFATPRHHDLVEVAKGFGHRAQRVSSMGEFSSALEVALTRGGLDVIVADVPSRTDNVELHAAWVTALGENV